MGDKNPPTTPNRRYYYGAYDPYHFRGAYDDKELAAEVRNHLVWDEWVNADQVVVDVQAGVVTLNGEVDSIIEKRAAGDDAWDTPGVGDVRNLLRVRRPVLQP